MAYWDRKLFFCRSVQPQRGLRLILMDLTVKNLPVLQDTRLLSLGGKDHLAEEMATHSSIRAWRIKWIEETVRLQPMGLQRFRHKWMTNTFSLKSLDLFVTYNKFYWYWTVLIVCVCVLYREQTKYSWLWNNTSLNCVGILIGVYFSTVNNSSTKSLIGLNCRCRGMEVTCTEYKL